MAMEIPLDMSWQSDCSNHSNLDNSQISVGSHLNNTNDLKLPSSQNQPNNDTSDANYDLSSDAQTNINLVQQSNINQLTTEDQISTDQTFIVQDNEGNDYTQLIKLFTAWELIGAIDTFIGKC